MPHRDQATTNPTNELICPVQTPEAGGPTARETLGFVRALSGLSVIGADVVETNPLYDGPGQVTALLAATVASEIIALIASEWSA